MRDPYTSILRSDSPEQTCAIAQRLAQWLTGGDTLLLHGDIGAGKTHLARCLIQFLLPVPEDVPSPTYTLVQTYPGRGCDIWHADLYRLTDTNEVFELGLIDAMSDAICLIEWPDRLGDLAPAGALDITLAAGDTPEARILTFAWQHPRWAARIGELTDG